MRIRVHARIAVAALLFGGCTTFHTPRPVNDAAPGATTFHEIAVHGARRTFLLHLPPGSATHRVPLVFVFHGHKANAAVAMRTSDMNRVADSLGMAVVYPSGSGLVRGLGLSWNVGSCCGWAQSHGVDDISFVDSLLVVLQRSGWVDTRAVFAAGFSAGGMLALKLACERADVFQGVADLAGAMPPTACAPKQPVAVLFVRGDDDEELVYDHAVHAAQGGPAYARSIDSAAAFWERTNRCDSLGATNVRTDLRTGIRTQAAPGCAKDRAVTIVSIPAHPHAWPGGRAAWWLAPKPSRAINGAALVLGFFAGLLPPP